MELVDQLLVILIDHNRSGASNRRVQRRRDRRAWNFAPDPRVSALPQKGLRATQSTTKLSSEHPEAGRPRSQIVRLGYAVTAMGL